MIANEGIYQMLTVPERLVWDWLTKHGIEFEAQQSVEGGRLELAGAVVDFILPMLNIVLRIQGTYWHTGIVTEAEDILSKERLIAQGYTVVDIWESDLTLERIDTTMLLAIQGREVPR